MFSQCTWFINDGAARDPPETRHTASFHQKNQINGISSSAFKYSLGLEIQLIWSFCQKPTAVTSWWVLSFYMIGILLSKDKKHCRKYNRWW